MEAPFAFDLEQQIHALAEKLEQECKADENGAHRAFFFTQFNKSFTNVKLRW